MQKQNTTVFSLLAFLVFLISPLSAGADVDNSIYADLLDRFVRDGRVNYRGFQSEEKRLDEYLDVLGQIDPSTLTEEEQFAFYVNVYNAWTIKLVLSGYPGITSIKDLGSIFKSPWKKKIVRLADGVYTLDNIEHDILRPRFKDPRVHFAVNCASLSCPVLRSEPYSGRSLNRQLNDATRRFINNPERNYLQGSTFHASKIFKWFSEDFNDDPIAFIQKFADPPLKQNLLSAGDKVTIRYLEYDWSLNGD